VFLAGSWCDLTQAIGVSFDRMLANPAGKCLQFKIVAIFRMRHASR
jgi:hypothetical protein